jgi:putative cardiolipin synthase
MRTPRKLLLLLPPAILMAALALSSLGTLPALDRRISSTALHDVAETRLGRAVQVQVGDRPGLTGIMPLVDGEDAFAARMMLARAAERSLDVQYYIWRHDTTGRLLFEALRQAAARGVRVRLLLDDNNTAGIDPVLARLDAHAAIEVRVFNPTAFRKLRILGLVADFGRLNRRMHNKSFTADNQVTIVGGRNIGNEYFGATSDVAFADLDVMAIGAVVPTVSADFDRYWNSASAYPLSLFVSAGADAQAEAPAGTAKPLQVDPGRYTPHVEQFLKGASPLIWAPARMVSDEPAKVLGKTSREAHVTFQLASLMGEPRRTLELISPYFVPGKQGSEAFLRFAHDGARIRVLTNSLEATDVVAVHAGYAPWRKQLLKAGVKLYELRRDSRSVPRGWNAGISGSSDASLHAKTFAVDGQRVFVGSFNVDQRSFHLNTEMGLVIDSPDLARRLVETLDEALPERAYELGLHKDGSLYWLERRDGKLIRHDVEPGTSWWKRTTVKLLSMLPIEWLL